MKYTLPISESAIPVQHKEHRNPRTMPRLLFVDEQYLHLGTSLAMKSDAFRILRNPVQDCAGCGWAGCRELSAE